MENSEIIEKISIKSLFILLKTAQAVVQKPSRKNVMPTVLSFFFFSVFLMDVMGGKITINLKELHKNRKIRNTCTLEKS
jgi:hypothetical protein